jgi:hypothetical protein
MLTPELVAGQEEGPEGDGGTNSAAGAGDKPGENNPIFQSLVKCVFCTHLCVKCHICALLFMC